MNATENKIDLSKYNIEYSVEFIPISKSRNKDDKEHVTLNWKPTIKRRNASVTVDYSEGSGHIIKRGIEKIRAPRYRAKIERLMENETAETRKLWTYYENIDAVKPMTRPLGNKLKKHLQPEPKIEDVLYCLLSDMDVLNYSTFEAWASDFGYDTDSRSGEKVYQDCLKIALEFRQLFSEAELEELRELFQDY